LKTRWTLLNVIPFNSLEGTGLDAGNGVSYERPDAERIREIVTLPAQLPCAGNAAVFSVPTENLPHETMQSDFAGFGTCHGGCQA